MLPQDKSTLRKTILHQRQSLTYAQWQIKSNLICNTLVSFPLFQQAETVFAYFSFRQEPDLSSLFSLHKKWAFPRCVNQSLDWHLWQPGESLHVGKYGIKEPLKTATKVMPASADLILVPTVAVDQKGYRLGYGGGFYDRLLSLPECATISTIAIVFDFACIAVMPVDSWDATMDFVCTETRLKSY